MSGVKLYILVFSLSLAVLLMALDMSILVTAIPLITEKFQSTADIGWYMSGYFLTLCSLQPLSGKLYANFSLKYTFLIFFAIFELGSLLSGAATSSPMLITGRAIAGAGAAGLMSGTLSIIAVAVELRLRALYTGIISSMFGIALIVGPLLGGAFTEHVSWRWVFYINLPIGGVIIPALVVMFKPPVRKVEQDPVIERIKRLDLIGAAMFIPAVIMLLMALQWGGLTYPWSSARIIGLLVGGFIIMIIFSTWQYRAGNAAMIPPSILTQRSVFWACLCAMFGMGAQTMIGLWLPEWFQVIKGESPIESGVHLLPTMAGQCISALVSGILITKLGYYNPWILLGTAMMSVGCGLYTTMEVQSGMAEWIGYQALYGLGSGMFITGPLLAIQGVLTPEETPVGISTVTFFQMFGGALFSAVSQTIFNTQLLKQLARNLPDVDVSKLLTAGTAAIMTVVKPEQIPAVLESYNTALLSPFYLGASVTAVSCVCALGLEWVNVKGTNLAAAGGA
ncbi:MFS general substrate transporter [Byssothecium circinans]|uniref:MFS general substrate transporter n=1 Tax=Byssothecium circinans TaxID=147558 RepID=A0A6A5TFJ0_9PLEO|nr:MFS general substrate transporter [Byssothecium circinans]